MNKHKNASRKQAVRARLEKLNKPFYLNLTSMVDMFTILLVFLLLTFSVTDVAFSPPKGVVLPGSVSTRVPSVLVKIAVSPDQISVEEKAVVNLQKGRVRPEDVQGLVIFPLYRELKAIVDSKKQGDAPFEKKIILQGDRTIPFSTLKRILFTAGQAEFEGFRFMTQQKAGAE